jgi:hypothetical protein
MANFQLAPKLYIANTKKDLTLLFFTLAAGGFKQATIPADDPNTTGTNEHTSAVAAADLLKIVQSGDFLASNIKEFSAARAVPGTKQVEEVTFAGSSLKAGSIGSLKVTFSSVDKPSHLMNYDARDYSRSERFQIVINAGDTPTKVAELVEKQINALAYKLKLEGFTTVRSGAKLTLTAIDETIRLKAELSMENPDSNLSITTNTVSKQYTGRGTHHELKTWRIANDTNSRPYAGTGPYDGNSNELPVEGRLYSSFLIKQSVERPDLSGSSMVNDGPIKGDFEWHLYINEELKEEVQDIVTFFEANATVKNFYPAKTANEATAAETPEADSTNFLAGL